MMQLTVAHAINRRRANSGRPKRKVALAVLRAKEKALNSLIASRRHKWPNRQEIGYRLERIIAEAGVVTE